MYTLTHDGDDIGTTLLEQGDPSTRAVSGKFNNVGGAKAIAGWMKSIGGEEDQGVVFIELNRDFVLADQAGNALTFEEATLISIPDKDEVFLDVVDLAEEDYKTYFSAHMNAMNT